MGVGVDRYSFGMMVYVHLLGTFEGFVKGQAAKNLPVHAKQGCTYLGEAAHKLAKLLVCIAPPVCSSGFWVHLASQWMMSSATLTLKTLWTY